MKKILYFFATAGSLIVLSCNKAVESTDNLDDSSIREVELTINVKAEDASDTKTYIEKVGSTYTPYWSNGDKLCIMNSSDFSSKKTFTNGAASGSAASFTGTVSLADGDNTLVGFYPQNVNKIDRSGSTYKLSWVNNDIQTIPLLTTFDPLHDIMVAKPLVVHSDGATEKTSVEMQFKRIMAVIKVILVDNTTKGYLDAAHVTSVKLTSSTVNLAGRICFDAASADAVVSSIDGTTSTSVTANYAGGDYSIDGINAAYIIVPPVTLASGTTLTIDVVTDDATLTISKAVALPKDFVFAEGMVTPLTVSITDACVAKAVGAVLSLSVTSVDGISYTGAAGNTISSAYSMSLGDESGVDVTVDGTVVTAASISGGTITYTTSTNPDCSRTGWIGLEDGSAVVQKVYVNQSHNPSTVDTYTWDFTTDEASGSIPKTNTYSYVSGTCTAVATSTGEHVLYIYSGKDPKFNAKSMSVTPKTKYYYFQYGGVDDYLFINSSKAGKINVWATVGNTTGAAVMDIKVDGVASGNTVGLNWYDTSKEMLGASMYSWPVANSTGDPQQIQIIKSSGDKSPWVYKIVYEAIK